MLKNFTYLLFVPLLLFACKKENDSTVRKTQSQLEAAIRANDVEQVHCYIGPNNILEASSRVWEFENGYIVFHENFGTEGFNLATLERYDVVTMATTTNPTKTLRLYFK